MTLFAGFDTFAFPGLAQTAWLRANTNAAWMGFYLPAPEHPQTGWVGHRAGLVGQGWGLAPLYVGRQTGDRINAVQGMLDGADCAKRLAAEPWPDGTTVYLDIEEGPPLRETRVDYCSAWAVELMRAGFRAGFYASHLMTRTLQADLQRRNLAEVRMWPYMMASVDPTALTSLTLPIEDPAEAMPGAVALQHAQAVTWHLPGAPAASMLIDIDTATLADPSAP